MIRGVDKATSNVHIFSSHFFTALSDEGPQVVESWTAKKNIDIFQKKLVFIPINRSLHWSLAVLINPGAVVNAIEYHEDPDDICQNPEEKGLPCMVFLDSLKAHKKSWVYKHVRIWLNSEWKRLGKAQEREYEDPFKQNNFPVFDCRGECLPSFDSLKT